MNSLFELIYLNQILLFNFWVLDVRADSLEEVKVMQKFTLSVACHRDVISWCEWITQETLCAFEINI